MSIEILEDGYVPVFMIMESSSECSSSCQPDWSLDDLPDDTFLQKVVSAPRSVPTTGCSGALHQTTFDDFIPAEWVEPYSPCSDAESFFPFESSSHQSANAIGAETQTLLNTSTNGSNQQIASSSMKQPATIRSSHPTPPTASPVAGNWNCLDYGSSSELSRNGQYSGNINLQTPLQVAFGQATPGTPPPVAACPPPAPQKTTPLVSSGPPMPSPVRSTTPPPMVYTPPAASVSSVPQHVQQQANMNSLASRHSAPRQSLLPALKSLAEYIPPEVSQFKFMEAPLASITNVTPKKATRRAPANPKRKKVVSVLKL